MTINLSTQLALSKFRFLKVASVVAVLISSYTCSSVRALAGTRPTNIEARLTEPPEATCDEREGRRDENEVTPCERRLRAMQMAKTMTANDETDTATKLPTVDEYLVSSFKLLFDKDKANDAQAHYRIGWLMWIAGPHPKHSKEALQEASDEFLIAANPPHGDAKYLYLYFKTQIELDYETGRQPNVDKGSRLDTLYEILTQKDLRYYVHVGSDHFLTIDFLALLLEDENYAALALEELKKLPREELVTLPGYLKYPYYTHTVVETRLLNAIAGREPEVLPQVCDILDNLESVQFPRFNRYQNRLLLSEVDVFTQQEIDFLPGGKRRANSIRGAQIEAVVARTQGANNYLQSRIELYQGLIARSKKAVSATK